MFGPFTLCQEQYSSRLKLTSRRQSLPNDVYVQLRRLQQSDRVELKVQHGHESHLIDMYLCSKVVLETFQAELKDGAEQRREVLSLYLPSYSTKLILSLDVPSSQQRSHLVKFRDALFPSLNNIPDSQLASPTAAKKSLGAPLGVSNKENQDANIGKKNINIKRKDDCPLRSEALQCSSPFLSPIKAVNEDKHRDGAAEFDLLLDVTRDLIDMTQVDDDDRDANMKFHEIRDLCVPTQAPLQIRKAVSVHDHDAHDRHSNTTRSLHRDGSGLTPQAKRSTKNKVSPKKEETKVKSPSAGNNLMRYFMANKKAEAVHAQQQQQQQQPAQQKQFPREQRTMPFAPNSQHPQAKPAYNKATTKHATTSSSSSNVSVARNLIADPSYSTVGAVELSSQQTFILERCLSNTSEGLESNNNVFYTGGGGTGKSLLLKQIIARCVEKLGAAAVFVTATTGLAACAIGGSTIHQFLGIPAVDEEDSDQAWETLYNQVISRKSGGAVHRAMQAKVLIIDEISMLGPKLFDLLDRTLRKLRNVPSVAMGGVQIICCGDFFQLPPVSNKANIAKSYSQQAAQSSRYCFQANSWDEVFPSKNCFELEQVYRQAGDRDYVAILNDIRVGKWSLQAQQMLQECVGKPLHTNVHGVMPTIIFTHKRDVDQLNQQKLKELVGESFSFQAKDSAIEKPYLTALQRNCPAKEQLILKVGAQVILVKTITASSCYGGSGSGLVNGAKGVVVRFNRETKTPVVKFTDGSEHTIFNAAFTISVGGRVVAERSQVPLDLAWGISVHKAQGMSVDQAELHLKNAFETGQVYVALSRVRSREGLSLKTPISMHQIRADPIVVEFYQKLARSKRSFA